MDLHDTTTPDHIYEVRIEHAIAIDKDHAAGKQDVLRQHHALLDFVNAYDHATALMYRARGKSGTPAPASAM
jgi:hypothetical protein